MKLTDVEILRTNCEVHVNTSGYFEVYLAGRADEEDARSLAGSSTTLDEAIEKAKTPIRQRRVRVAVPFFTIDRLASKTAVGFHAGNGNILLADGEQLSGYGSQRALGASIPERDRTRLARLRQEVRAAEKEIRTITEKYTFDLGQAVTAAIDAKTPAIDGN